MTVRMDCADSGSATDEDEQQETEATEHGHGDEPPAAHSNTTALQLGIRD